MEQTKKNKSVRSIPEGFHTITPYLVAENAQGLIDFIENAFGGRVTFISKTDNGKISHATMSIGDSIVMISDAMEGMPPQPAMLYLYFEDVDAVFRKAVQAKAAAVRQPLTEFYGDRSGAVKDQWNNMWWIATHVEDVDDQELERRMKKVMEERKKKGSEVHA